MNKMKKKFIHEDEQDDSRLNLTTMGDFKSFSSLFRYVKGYKWYYITAVILMLFSSFMAMSSAWFMGQLVEKGLMAKNSTLTWKLAIIITVLESSGLFIMWTSRKFLAKGGTFAILKIREQLIDKLQTLPLEYYDHNPQGRIVTRITHDVEALETFFTFSLGRLMTAGFMTIFAITAIIITDYKIGSILVLSIMPAIFFLFVTRKKTRAVHRRMSKFLSNVNSKLSEFLSGLEVIRSFGLEKWSAKSYFNSIDLLVDSSLKANSFMAATRPLVSFLSGLPIIVLLGVGGYSVIAGSMTVGIFVAFLRYCERFIHPFMHLAREFNIIQEAFTKVERIVAFLDEGNEDDLFGPNGLLDNKSNINLRGDLEFKDVSMYYSKNEWILNNVSFKISQGEKIGLVGTTGCGKTTTVSLLARLYDYQKGQITLDDKSIKDFNRNYLRSRIGFVSQDVVIFKGTIRENLKPSFSIGEEEILSACRKTGFLQVMHKNSQTLDSLILSGGSNLSIGERQLLALTRITLKKPEIMIMDEATANIDPDYEKIIHNAVDLLMKDKTCIIIAHRLDTLKSVDRILVFKEGEIVEKGNIDELLKKQGHFYNLQISSEKNSIKLNT